MLLEMFIVTLPLRNVLCDNKGGNTDENRIDDKNGKVDKITQYDKNNTRRQEWHGWREQNYKAKDRWLTSSDAVIDDFDAETALTEIGEILKDIC